MESDYKVRGNVLRYHRTRQRMSQQRLAEKAGLSIGQVSRIETGKIAAPHFSTIEKLAGALGIEADDLVEFLLPDPNR